ncbi:MAG: hypothetical protein IKY66_05315 [Bacteroidales bacterium]|nr:hypothetical protein [Bacteroidales bacterium]
MSKIERVYHPYWLWEDAKMYHPPMIGMIETGETKEERWQKAIDLLTNSERFYTTAKDMMKAFPYACEHNLTNTTMNRIAYIGQASCFFLHGLVEEEVRGAWGYLTEEQRNEANETARKTLEEWENEYIQSHA